MYSANKNKQCFAIANNNKEYHSKVFTTKKDLKFNESALLSFKIAKLKKQIKELKDNIGMLNQSKSNLENSWEDTKILTAKWEGVCKKIFSLST